MDQVRCGIFTASSSRVSLNGLNCSSPISSSKRCRPPDLAIGGTATPSASITSGTDAGTSAEMRILRTGEKLHSRYERSSPPPGSSGRVDTRVTCTSTTDPTRALGSGMPMALMSVSSSPSTDGTPSTAAPMSSGDSSPSALITRARTTGRSSRQGAQRNVSVRSGESFW